MIANTLYTLNTIAKIKWLSRSSRKFYLYTTYFKPSVRHQISAFTGKMLSWYGDASRIMDSNSSQI